VRLTYDRHDQSASARLLSTADLKPLMAEPLLRSARAIEGLFHRVVVVTEADADRAFYDEINRRMVGPTSRGVRDAQFINAQNWQTVPRILLPLRRLGVPAAAILDLDAIWGTSGVWRLFFDAAGLDETEVARIELLRANAKVGREDRKLAKERGVAALSSAERSSVDELLRSLGHIGIFVVPVGELENWLPEVGVTTRQKHNWIVEMLTRLGSSASAPDYVAPEADGVWAFLDTIAEWAEKPSRMGMPG